MTINSRAKGKRGELEVCKILHAHGWGFAERTSRGTAQAGKGDIAYGPAGCHLEIKSSERLRLLDAFDQIERDASPLDMPLLIHRPSRHDWMVTLKLEDLLPLLALRERGL